MSPTIVSYGIVCRAGYGNCIGVPTFMEFTSGGTRVTAAQIKLISTVSGPPAVGRLAVGSWRGGWRITERLEVPMGRSHVLPLNATDEVASLILQPGQQRPVTMSVEMSVESPLYVGATHYPIWPQSFFSVSFARSLTRPGIFLCCDFGPLDHLDLDFLNDAGEIILPNARAWPTGRTFVPLPQDATALSVSYKPDRGELAPPASLILQWLAGII
jgi:hypothetical protein